MTGPTKTADEIYEEFRTCEHLPESFRWEVLNMYTGLHQAMYNAVHTPDHMILTNIDDGFHKMHNRVVELLQEHSNG